MKRRIWNRLIAVGCAAALLMTPSQITVFANEPQPEDISVAEVSGQDLVDDVDNEYQVSGDEFEDQSNISVNHEENIYDESLKDLELEVEEDASKEEANDSIVTEDMIEASQEENFDDKNEQDVIEIDENNNENIVGYTNHNQNEAVAWIRDRKNEGWAKDYDGAAGPQCVDLIKYYFDYLVGYHLNGNGYQFADRTDLPSGWYYTSTPSPGDIAVWKAYTGIAIYWTGHVALVESVGNGTFNYVDINGATGRAGSGSISNTNPSTFIHPDFAPVPVTVSFTPWSDDNYTYIRETDASIGMEINVSGGTCTSEGMYLYDSNGSYLASASNPTHTLARVYFQVNAEMGYTLRGEATYKYKFYAVVNGQTYWSNEYSFTTSPPAVTNINNCTVTLSATSYTYNGSARTPSVTVKNGSTTLTSGTNYTVSYSNNVNAGTATVAVTGKGYYTGTVYRSFNINKAVATLSFDSASINKTDLNTTFTNSLTKTTDGTVTFQSSNTAVATVNSTSGLVTVKGAGIATITATATEGANYKAASTCFTLLAGIIVGSNVVATFDADTGAVEFYSNSGELWRDWVDKSGIDRQSVKSIKIKSGTIYLPRDSAAIFSINEDLEYLDLSGFDTSNVTSMHSMFDNCRSLTNLDLSGFNTSNVTNMRHMFSDCESLTELDLSSFNTSNVADMSYMFLECKGLTSVDVSSFNTSNVRKMDSMFDFCSSLTFLDLSSFDMSKVKFNGVDFLYCEKLTTLKTPKKNTTTPWLIRPMYDENGKLYNELPILTKSIILKTTISIESASVGGVSLSYGYTGKAYKPTVTVRVAGETLTKGTDYTVKYENNVKPGTAKITVTGKGKYTGTKTKTFEIVDCVSSVVSGKTYLLIPKNNSKTAVCAVGGKMVNNTKVYITDRGNSESQKFKAVKNSDGTWKFINAKCELALAVQQNSSELGAGLVLYDQTTKPAQNWKLSKKSDNSFAIINSVTGYSIAMSDKSAVKGTTLSMAETASVGLQRFYIVETSAVSAPFDGTNSIRAAKDQSFAVNIASSSKEDGANVSLYTYTNSNARKFKIIYSGGGYYRLVNVNSGLCLTIKDNSNEDGANVIQSKWKGYSSQRWKIMKNSDGTVTITNMLGTVLHLLGNRTTNNTNIHARKAASTTAQKWYLN